MAVPYTFGAATSAIPLSQLDSNFATTITLGNTAIQLGNTVTTLNNMTLANVTVSSGTVTLPAQQANAVVYLNGSNVVTANASVLSLVNGNIGLGTANTPTGQSSDNRVIQIYGAGSSNRAQVHFCNSNTGETATDGSFIGVDSSTNLYIINKETSATIFENANSEAARFDSSNNFGLGVTPSAWRTAYSQKAIQVGPVGFISSLSASSSNNQTFVGSNFYTNTSNQNIYINSDYASQYAQFAGQHSWNVAPSGTAGASFSFTQAMTLDASSALLVNTTSKSYSNTKFAVAATADNANASVEFQITSGNSIFNWASTAFASNLSAGSNLIHFIGQAGSNKNSAYIGYKHSSSGSNSNILTLGLFGVDNVLNINGNAYVGVNTTTPGYTLDVNGTVHYTTLTASSDKRFKTKVTPITDALQSISKIQAIRFEWNEFVNSRRSGYELEKPTFGFIAQDVQKVFPELVTQWELSEDCKDALSVNYEKMIPVLLAAIQEQQAIISQLQADVAALKGTK